MLPKMNVTVNSQSLNSFLPEAWNRDAQKPWQKAIYFLGIQVHMRQLNIPMPIQKYLPLSEKDNPKDDATKSKHCIRLNKRRGTFLVRFLDLLKEMGNSEPLVFKQQLVGRGQRKKPLNLHVETEQTTVRAHKINGNGPGPIRNICKEKQGLNKNQETYSLQKRKTAIFWIPLRQRISLWRVYAQ